MRNTSYSVAFIGAAMLSLSSCATVPPETVQLSHSIGSDLAELHRSHRALAKLHFQKMREDINRFIEINYRPALVQKTAQDADFLANASILIEQDPARLPAYLSAFLLAVDPLVERKKAELLDPIDAQEEMLLSEIDLAHGQLLSANSVISGHLASIRDVHEAQATALERVGIDGLRERISVTTARISDQIDQLDNRGQRIASSVDEVEERVEELDGAIESAIDELKEGATS